jgi:uncharacterized glyoxalase superfamily protein PhnB
MAKKTKSRRKPVGRKAVSTRKAARPRKAASTRARRTQFKPSRYTSVAPYIITTGAQKVIDFLKQVFGASELRRYDMPDGTIMHAEVRIDDTVVMVADAGGEWPAVPMNMHVYVPDVDGTYRRALAAGGTSTQEPAEREGDPDRRGGFKDPGGNSWWVGTQRGS